MNTSNLQKLVIDTLEEMKASEIIHLDVHELTSITDTMIICTGRSSQHVKSVANKLIEAMKKAGETPLGSVGQETAEWVLVDLNNVVVHIMQAEIREFYNLEQLWSYAA